MYEFCGRIISSPTQIVFYRETDLRLPCKGSCRAYARLRDLEMKKHMYFVQSLRHFLTKMTPPFTREAFWQVRILRFRQFYHPDKSRFTRGSCRGGYYPPAENSYKTNGRLIASPTLWFVRIVNQPSPDGEGGDEVDG